MKKKQYKVKYENGEIKPLEPLDMENNQEGIVIFFHDLERELKKSSSADSKILASKDSLEKVWNNQEDDIYNDL